MKKSNKKISKKKLGKSLVITGIVYLMVALSLFAYNKITDFQAGEFSEKVMQEITEYMQSDSKKSTQQKDNQENKNTDNPTENRAVSFEGYDFIGYLTVEKLSLNLPIMADWNYDRLNISPCRYSGSVSTSDLVIAGHNYSSHFGTLSYLEKGDSVLYTDFSNHTYHYRVELIEILQPTETKKMSAGEYDLSLFTCNLSGQARVTVRCKKISV